MQHCMLEGAICKKDPELTSSKSGTPICKFTIGLQGGWGKNKRVDYPRCIAFGKTAETIAKYFKKKSIIQLSGEFQNSPYRKDEKGYDIDNWQFVVSRVDFPPKNAVHEEETVQYASDDSQQFTTNDDFVPISDDSADLPF